MAGGIGRGNFFFKKKIEIQHTTFCVWIIFASQGTLTRVTGHMALWGRLEGTFALIDLRGPPHWNLASLSSNGFQIQEVASLHPGLRMQTFSMYGVQGLCLFLSFK